MKTRFSTLDIIAILPELKNVLCTGWRVNQIYDCDYKTYLFKLNKSIVQMKKDTDPLNVGEVTENKMTFVIESGLRIHTTNYDWPKAHTPGQFATKLRKSLRNKRVEDIKQLGIDRVIDIQFGSNMAANHLIIELYDRGNLILTDHDYKIIAILRWRKTVVDKPNSQKSAIPDVPEEETDGFKVGQIYPLDNARKEKDLEAMTEDKIIELLNNYKILMSSNFSYKRKQKAIQSMKPEYAEINLKDLFNPYVVYGSSLLEDKLLKHLFKEEKKPPIKCIIRIPMDDKEVLNQNKVKSYARNIRDALDEAEQVLNEVKNTQRCDGYLVQKKLVSPIAPAVQTNKNKKKNQAKDEKCATEDKTVVTNVDFFPIESCAKVKVIQGQAEKLTYEVYESFDKAVDIYYSNLEGQKLDSKTLVAEKEARKKLDNLKISQDKRLNDLAKAQKDDEEKARLIELNCDKVEKALLILRSLIANQMSWSDIRGTIAQAQSMSDPIASLIVGVKFDSNMFVMRLTDPYESEDERAERLKNKKPNYRDIDVDISLSAHANARRFFDRRRTAVDKEKKTIEVSKKAFKNVERKTKEMLKEVVVHTNITKARKRYWFENFFWFISTDGFLVVAGRDAEQNDLLAKRYMKTNDIYVHADLHGAASVIIKNESTDPVPPKTLNEAGCMAVCYSSAWDSKIATTSWWVYPKQVSKTAPAGEYLSTGAFIIRGKKNFLPLSSLVLGFGFLFRLDEESIDRKKAQRVAKEKSISNRETSAESKQLKGDDYDKSNYDVELTNAVNDDDAVDLPISDASDTESDKEADRTMNDLEQQVEMTDDQSDADDILDDDDDGKVVEHRLIDTLTEAPLPDDALLYAIPMCGPYSAFQSFKYKVKVVPGANKRGKAAKACLGLFMHDKRATQREKDILRSLKDQDYARNIPNKVKISAANMKTIVKKKPKKSEVRLPMF